MFATLCNQILLRQGRQYRRSLEWALSKLPPSALILGSSKNQSFWKEPALFIFSKHVQSINENKSEKGTTRTLEKIASSPCHFQKVLTGSLAARSVCLRIIFPTFPVQAARGSWRAIVCVTPSFDWKKFCEELFGGSVCDWQ